MRYAVPLIFLLLAGCLSTDAVRSRNRERLLGLSPGMTKAEVLEVMGTKTIRTSDTYQQISNPYRTEFFEAGGHAFEILLYYTDRKSADGAITDDELTPLVIRDGELAGWGWSYWDDQVARYEIRVR